MLFKLCQLFFQFFKKCLFIKPGGVGLGFVATQVMPSPRDTSLPLVAEYQKDATAFAQPGVNTDSYGTLEGYVNARVLVHMLQAAGPNLSRAELIHTFETSGDFDLAGLPLAFSPDNHQGSRKVYLTHIVSGSVVPVDASKK